MVGKFACSFCSKVDFLDVLSKHNEKVINGITVIELLSLLKGTQANISEDLNYSNV